MRITYMDIKEFRELGLLQEINRLFLHPLGLALEILIEDDGKEKLGNIWDYREDPEGMHYASQMVATEEFKKKAETVSKMQQTKMKERIKSLGYYIQPLDNSAEKKPEEMSKEDLVKKCKYLESLLSSK